MRRGVAPWVEAVAALSLAFPTHARTIEIAVLSELQPQRALKAGEFAWMPENAPKGELVVVIDLADQLAHVYRGGHEIGRATISTGKAGHRTPVGAFRILEKKILHNSTSYNLAPMPFMQRLTWDGVALHGGVNPGAPVSRGCVRLPDAFAQALYWETRIGGLVGVVRDWDSSVAPVEREMTPAEIRMADIEGR